MTRAVIAAIYGMTILAILVCVLRWEVRRVQGRSAGRSKPAPQRMQKALSSWLTGYVDEPRKKPRRREAA